MSSPPVGEIMPPIRANSKATPGGEAAAFDARCELAAYCPSFT
ncbi:hypothetical protein AVEN_82607-1, partial [Araneus ventricosus]